jgi:TolB-like protein
MAIHVFGPFRLDAEAEILFRGADLVPIGRRAVALLRVLLESPGEPVSKDALMEGAWAGLAVEESNLTVQIATLRRALGEEPGGERWIETLPRRGYRFRGPTATKEVGDQSSKLSAEPPAFAASDKPSIAVLPFQNMSGDPEQEYFADGMVDEIITGLSRIKWLSVISRSSTSIYKDKPALIKEVADKFGVRYVLEGGVRRSGNRVRITAQLIGGKTDTHLWAEQYDGVLGDVFTLQDEITMSVVGAIEPSLWKAEIDRIKRQRPKNLNAYDLVLRSLPFVLGRFCCKSPAWKRS